MPRLTTLGGFMTPEARGAIAMVAMVIVLVMVSMLIARLQA